MHLWRSLVFVKVACRKISQNHKKTLFLEACFLINLYAMRQFQNSKGSNCVGVSFLIKLQPRSTTLTPNCLYTCIFVITLLVLNLNFLYHLHSMLLLITGHSGNCLDSANIISKIDLYSDGLRKKT